MKRPALVLFDLDEVLVGYDHGIRLAVLAERTGTTAKRVHRALFSSGVEQAADQGDLDVPGTITALSAELDATVTLDDWIAARTAAMSPRPEVLALAHGVARRASVAILTNNGLLLREHLDRMHPPLFPLFRGRVFCSAQYHLAKPDPAIFLRCVAGLGFAPGATLFIDDKAANAEGARQAGLMAHHFLDPGRLRAELHQLDLLEPLHEPH